jgi:hypothetical protein
MSTILVKRFKETTAITKREEYRVDGANLEALAKSILEGIKEDGKVVWAQVQVDARVTVLVEVRGE